MYARDNTAGINHLYWQTAAWVALLSFPGLIACCSLAGPVTTLLLGERYAAAGPILAVLSVGYFFNAALGFNALTLKVYGRVRVIVINDLLGAVTLVAANLLLVPRYGVMGAAVATCATFIIHNLLNQVALLKVPGIEVFERRYIALYLTMATAAAVLLALQTVVAPPLYVSIVAAIAVCLLVQWAFRDLLAIGNMFPELARSRFVRVLLGT
jgi:O-antigen/teichoic acid export membrane protein